jgi:hypothetical protein
VDFSGYLVTSRGLGLTPWALFMNNPVLILGGGPSLDLYPGQADIPTLGINRYAYLKGIHIDMHIAVDAPEFTPKSLFEDEKIQKFTLWEHEEPTKHHPNITYFKAYFDHDATRLWNRNILKQGLKTILCAIRVMYVQGFREMYFLGCDMNDGLYEETTNALFHHRDGYWQRDIHLFTCNPKNTVEAFTYVPLEDICGIPVP